jgi:hypothetical protein
LIEKLKTNCHQLFIESSYTMFNILEYLSVITANLVLNVKSQKQIAKYIENFKHIILEANRFVRDQMEYQGRVQVKVFITNFTNKCEYFLSRLEELPHRSGIFNKII